MPRKGRVAAWAPAFLFCHEVIAVGRKFRSLPQGQPWAYQPPDWRSLKR